MNVFKREVNSSCLEFLLMEMVEVAMHMTDSDSEFTSSAAEVLEDIGAVVGQKLMERFCKEKDLSRFDEQVSSAKYCKEMELVKFICKDFWNLVFKKNLDGLRTNTGPHPKHKYVLQDHKFPWLKRFSTDNPSQTLKLAERYLCFPRGLIRGALQNLGLETEVTSALQIDGASLSCQFTVTTKSHLQAVAETNISTSPRNNPSST